MAMTQEELEQFMLDFMDAHIQERIAALTDDAIDQRIRQYMEENGAAVEDSGPTGDVPLVSDDHFVINNGQHMTDTSLPMVANVGNVPVSLCAISRGHYYPETYQYLGNEVAKHGTILEWSEIKANPTLLERYNDYSGEFVECIGKADIVNYVAYETGGTIVLPDPMLCVGKVVELYTSNLGTQKPIAQDQYYVVNTANRLMVTYLEVELEQGTNHSDRLWHASNDTLYSKTCIFGVPMKFQAVELQETHGGPPSYAWWCISGQRMTT